MSAPAACCRGRGAGWERLRLGKTGKLQTCSMHHPPGSYRQRVPSSVAPVSCQALGSNVKASAGPQFFVSEAMVDLHSNPAGPGSPELSQLWVQGELEQGQHLCASTQGRGGGVQRRQKPNGQTAGGSERGEPSGEGWRSPGDGDGGTELQQQLTPVRGSSPSRLISMNVITPPLLLPSSWPPGGGAALLAFAHRLRLHSSPP